MICRSFKKNFTISIIADISVETHTSHSNAEVGGEVFSFALVIWWGIVIVFAIGGFFSFTSNLNAGFSELWFFSEFFQNFYSWKCARYRSLNMWRRYSSSGVIFNRQSLEKWSELHSTQLVFPLQLADTRKKIDNHSVTVRFGLLWIFQLRFWFWKKKITLKISKKDLFSDSSSRMSVSNCRSLQHFIWEILRTLNYLQSRVAFPK